MIQRLLILLMLLVAAPMDAAPGGPIQTRRTAFRSSDPSATSLTNNLVAYWKLDEASGTRNDSAKANNLTDNNTVTQATGKIVDAAQFTAANSEYLSIADGTDLSTGDVDFSMRCWLYLDTKTARRPFAVKWIGTGNQREYWLEYDSTSDRLRWLVSNDGVATVTLTCNNTGSPSTATWYHVVAWHDSVNNVIGVRVNDTTEDTAAHTTGVFDSTTQFEMGAGTAGPLYMDGRIDEFAFWKKVLTTAEVTYDYNAGSGRTYNPATQRFE